METYLEPDSANINRISTVIYGLNAAFAALYALYSLAMIIVTTRGKRTPSGRIWIGVAALLTVDSAFRLTTCLMALMQSKERLQPGVVHEAFSFLGYASIILQSSRYGFRRSVALVPAVLAIIAIASNLILFHFFDGRYLQHTYYANLIANTVTAVLLVCATLKRNTAKVVGKRVNYELAALISAALVNICILTTMQLPWWGLVSSWTFYRNGVPLFSECVAWILVRMLVLGVVHSAIQVPGSHSMQQLI
jgi:hypothetical protein